MNSDKDAAVRKAVNDIHSIYFSFPFAFPFLFPPIRSIPLPSHAVHFPFSPPFPSLPFPFHLIFPFTLPFPSLFPLPSFPFHFFPSSLFPSLHHPYRLPQSWFPIPVIFSVSFPSWVKCFAIGVFQIEDTEAKLLKERQNVIDEIVAKLIYENKECLEKERKVGQ